MLKDKNWQDTGGFVFQIYIFADLRCQGIAYLGIFGALVGVGHFLF